MAKVEWGYQGRGKLAFSYKKTTLIICSINIIVALYVLRSLYASLYLYTDNDSRSVVKYTPDQIRKMEQFIRIRRASKPVELIKFVKELKEFSQEETVNELPQPLKQKITEEILLKLRSSNTSSNSTQQREAVESWRKEKLEEARKLITEQTIENSTLSSEDAGILVKALETDWAVLAEEIGVWIPAEIFNREHDDKPEDADEFDGEVLPGRPLPPECNAELHTDYGGAAVRWGLTHHKQSAADCCQACLDHVKRAQPGGRKCNIWVYCPSETGCHSPDIYEHKYMECWLKYAETPKLNFKTYYPQSYRNSHPTAPLIVPWVSGVISV
ncbi:uncharacterized protein LOC111454084 [Cucurbita moschata]|uniref:Uncharacterized protein LOC111454084 n=1 Tax=Cucurbita moschata TaxID=3662 RepID=A0A6J1GGV9_CUCMO|nr:uncharacterized protein LOC111454084 [Cucurbita moschata]XP_022951154.1 uncharacterized protein LOC111454084 [Cucurbita moschata]